MTINQVWTEKYRPINIEDVILSEEEKNFFTSLKEIPNNLLLVGNPGIGKSTVAKILAKKFAPHSYMYINASEQGNIDTVRTLISEFISVSSIDGNGKVVILDEADGVSLAAQQALRSIMEEYLDSVKFILTANYRNKLIEALRSRCQEFSFTCSEKMVLTRIIQIIKSEKIVVPKESIENIKTLVKDFFPDIRKTINELQRCCVSGTFTYNKRNSNDFAREIKENLKEGKDVFEIRQKVVENTDKFGNDYHSLMKDLFHLYVRECNSIASILISEYMYRHSFVMDPEINFSALLFNLKSKI
jgi:DNA polymerase III delta prime subunit